MVRSSLAAAILLLMPTLALSAIPTRWYDIRLEVDKKIITYMTAIGDGIGLGEATPQEYGDNAAHWYVQRAEDRTGYVIKSSVGKGYLAYDPEAADGKVFLLKEAGKGTTWKTKRSGTGPGIDEEVRSYLEAGEGKLAGYVLSIQRVEELDSEGKVRVVNKVVLEREPRRPLIIVRMLEHR